MRLLIVEDEGLIRERLKRIIARCGLPIDIVGEASNGLEALTLALARKPDAAILDIEMPVHGGLDFLNASRDAGLSLKALVLTGFAQHSERARRLGVVDYLLKPVDETALVNALRRIDGEISREKQSAAASETPAQPG